MEKLSVYSLVRLRSQEAERELIIRYKEYVEKLEDVKVNEKTLSYFFNTLKDLLSSEGCLIDKFEKLSSIVNVNLLTNENIDEELSNILGETTSREKLLDYLKDVKTIASVYLILFLLLYVNYDNDKRMKVMLLDFSKISYFSVLAIVPLNLDKEYNRYYYEAYHAAFWKTDIKNLAKYYFNYPNSNYQSALYRCLNNEKINKEILAARFVNDDEKEELLFLIRKHNKSLLGYDEIKECVNDFDNYFKRVKDDKSLINVFVKEVGDNYNKYQNVVEFIMTLICFSFEVDTLAFGLSLSRVFNYDKDNELFYKKVEALANIPYLSYYAMCTLQNHPKYQKICYRLAENENQYVSLLAMENFDLSIKKNLNFIIKKMKDLNIAHYLGPVIVKKIDLFEFMDKENISKKEIEFIKNCLCGTLLDGTYPILNINDRVLLIERFYNKFVKTQNVDAHYLNMLLLLYCDTCKDESEENKAKINEIVLSNMIFEDEICYIDECLDNQDIDCEMVAQLMEFHQIFPVMKLKELVYSDPNKYLRFILTLLMIDNDEDFVDECVNLIDQNLKVSPHHLKIDNDEIDDSIQAEIEKFQINIS